MLKYKDIFQIKYTAQFYQTALEITKMLIAV